MFICWFGELMGDENDDTLYEHLNEETLDLYLDITYDERKSFSLWFEL